MRSWTPRRPSPRLEQRLFGPQPDESKQEASGFGLPWHQTLGVSLAACAALVFTVFNLSQSATAWTFSQPFAPLSNHLASLALDSAPHNTFSAPILGWTNDSRDGLHIRSFDLLNTNRPLH